MKLNRFYRDELSFLRLQGREFAEAHPQLTRFLSEQSTDPDVERLLGADSFAAEHALAQLSAASAQLHHHAL